MIGFRPIFRLHSQSVTVKLDAAFVQFEGGEMAEEKKPDRSIEMRLAEIEDKLSQMHVTEEEMRAYQKVANMMGMQGMQASAPGTTSPTAINRGIAGPIIRYPIMRYVCTCLCPCGPGFCNECTCGPCAAGGGGG